MKLAIQWIPGHSAIPGNKLVDKAAKEATTVATNTILPVPFSSSIQIIKELICDDPPTTHKRVAQVYQHQKVSQDSKQIKNRKDDVLLAHLRSGHHPSLHQYLHYECRAGDAIRQQVFGNHKGSLEWVVTRPGDVAMYPKKTLVNLDA